MGHLGTVSGFKFRIEFLDSYGIIAQTYSMLIMFQKFQSAYICQFI